MIGAKGGFWDRLRARFRKRKLDKRKKEELIKQKEEKSNKKVTIKIKEEQEINYILKKNSDIKEQIGNKKVKIKTKGISSKKTTSVKTKYNVNSDKKTKSDIECKSILPLVNKKKTQKNIISNTENNNNKPNIEHKSTLPISNKKVVKKKKGIEKDKVYDIETSKIDENSKKLMDELNKIINDSKLKINDITIEIENLKGKLDKTRTIKEVEEIERKLYELKQKLIELIETYSNVKNGEFKKLKNEKIDKLINEIKKIDNSFDFEEIKNKITPNLDYYNELSTNTVNTVNLMYKSEYQKDVINYHNNKEEDMKVELSDFDKIHKRLSEELLKQSNIINEFNQLINNISPKKMVELQNDFLTTLLHNTGCLIGTFLSIPFLKKPKNVPLFTFGLFTINNSIRSMRKVTTTEKINYIPSDDYTNQIIKYRNSFGFAEYMISDTLYQIRELKEEYSINFSSYHNLDVFEKNMDKINSIEEKILKQSKEIQQLKNKYNNTLDKNYQKVLSIKEMNK